MAIQRLLQNSAFEPEKKIIAEKIIEIAQTGERDPLQIRGRAIAELGVPNGTEPALRLRTTSTRRFAELLTRKLESIGSLSAAERAAFRRLEPTLTNLEAHADLVAKANISIQSLC